MGEYLRQFLHLFFGSVIIMVLVFLGKHTTLALSVVVFIFGLVLSYLLKRGKHIVIIEKILQKVQRPKEKDFPGYGAIVFFFGIILVLAFSPNFFVALGAICILVFGDAFSNIVGTRIGKIKVGKRYTLEGTIGGITISFIVLATFLPLFVALVVSTIAMLSEFLNFEDNISIPVVGTIVLSLLL